MRLIVLCSVALAGWVSPALAAQVPDSAPPDLGTRHSGHDWPTFLGPNGDGRSSEKLAVVPWPADGLPVVWQREVGEGYSMPSVARGRLFLFDRVGDRARLTALHAETGEELWMSDYPSRYEDMYDYSGGPRTTPVVDGAIVYAYGVEGRLRAHRMIDGNLVWEIDTADRYGVQQNFFGVGSTPVVEGDLLLVMVGGSPPDSPGIQSGKVTSNGTGIVAFDKHTGEERYRITDELASYSSLRVATIEGRRWGFAFARGGLVGFEPASGKVDFRFPWKAKVLESVNAATPIVDGNRVFITETYGPGGALLEVRPGGYRVLWQDGPRDKAMAAHWNTPLLHDGILYGSSGRNSGDADLRAVELATGEVRWSVPRLSRSTLLYVDGHFIVLTEYGQLLLIEATPEEYRVVSELDLSRPEGDRGAIRHPAWNPPILARGLLYVRGKDRLLAFDLGRKAAGN